MSPVRSGGSKLSFDLLAADSSGEERSLLLGKDLEATLENGIDRSPRRRRKPKASKKKKKTAMERDPSEDLVSLTELDDHNPSTVENGFFRDQEVIGVRILENRSVVETICDTTVVEAEYESSKISCISAAELRQRIVIGNADKDPEEEVTSTREVAEGQWKPESNGKVTKLAKEESLDWNQVMAQDPNLLGGNSQYKLMKGLCGMILSKEYIVGALE